MPREQRTGEIQRALYNWIERKDFNAMTPEDQAVLSDPAQQQNILGAATRLGIMRQELSNIYNRMRNLGFPDDQLVNPDYMHRRAVGHTPVVDPPLGTGAPDVITGAGRTLPRTTTALQERRFIGSQDINGNRVVVSRDPDSGALQVHVPDGRAPVQVAPHPTNDNEFLYNGRSWALGDMTSNEIERATAGEPHPVNYYHNALANTADTLARMRAVEPGALAAHAGICAGGGEQSSSLPRPLRISDSARFPHKDPLAQPPAPMIEGIPLRQSDRCPRQVARRG
jgi:hypothetical protein